MYLDSLKKTALASSLLLAACGSPAPREIQITTAPAAIQVYHPQLPSPIKLDDVTFKVVTSENIDEFLTAWKQRHGEHFVFIAFSVKDYEAMAINLQEIRRYMNQLKEIVIHYRKATNYEEIVPSSPSE